MQDTEQPAQPPPEDANASPGDVADSALKQGAARQPVELRVAHTIAGMRLDLFLTQLLPERSRSFYQHCIRDGYVRLNRGSCRPADRIKTNDLVEFECPPEKRVALVAEDIPFDVLMEDDDILVICKPAGLVVHPARGHWTGTLVHGLLGHDEESFSALADDEMRPGIVHRLDRDTSGAMVVAKNEYARAELARAFAERRVEKTYLTIVVGELPEKTGDILYPIGRHPINRLKMAVVHRGGKHAVTRWRVLQSTGSLSLVEVRIETGRTHQIRVHLAHLHHPVFGDHMYGGGRHCLEASARRQMLHAWKLSFPHPRTGLARQYMAPLPEDFVRVMMDAGMSRVGEVR